MKMDGRSLSDLELEVVCGGIINCTPPSEPIPLEQFTNSMTVSKGSCSNAARQPRQVVDAAARAGLISEDCRWGP